MHGYASRCSVVLVRTCPLVILAVRDIFWVHPDFIKLTTCSLCLLLLSSSLYTIQTHWPNITFYKPGFHIKIKICSCKYFKKIQGMSELIQLFSKNFVIVWVISVLWQNSLFPVSILHVISCYISSYCRNQHVPVSLFNFLNKKTRSAFLNLSPFN